jgi:phage repressor protein C with HTH and peptisase S24 domain
MVETSNQYPVRYPEFAARLQKAMADKPIDVNGIVDYFKHRKTKITYEMVRRYTLGQAMPRTARLELLAGAVGLRPVDLVFGESAADSGAEENKHTPGIIDVPISERISPVFDTSASPPPDTLDARKFTPQQRLKAALVPESVSAEALASVAKVGVDVASQWLAGEGPTITLVQAVALQNTYGVNSVWLTKGKGEPGVAVRWNDEYRPIPIKGSRVIPVVGMAQLGDNGHWSDLEYPVGHGTGYVDFPSRDKDAYALKCEGDSMSPRIEAGEFVIVEPNHPIKAGKNVLLKSTDGRVMVKKYLYSAAGRIYLVSINKAHAPLSFAREDIEKMHFIRAIVDEDAWLPDIPTHD